MKKVFILFLFFIPTFLLADDYEVDLYVLGDAEFIKAIFDAVAMLSNLDPDSDYGKMVHQIVVVGFSIGTLFAGRWLVVGDVKKTIYEIIFMIALVGFFLKGNTTVYIHDDRENSVTYGDSYKVDNVPLALAEMTAVASNSAIALAKIVDTALAPADDTAVGQYSKVGYGNNIKILTDFMQIASGKIDANKSLSSTNVIQYVKNCILSTEKKGSMYQIVNPTDSYKETFDYRNFDTANKDFNETTKCSEYYDDDNGFKSDFDEIGANLKDNFEKKEEKQGYDDTSKINDYTAMFYTNDQIGSVEDAASNIAISTVLIPTAVKGASTGVAGVDAAADISAAKAKSQMMINSTGQFQWLQEMIPYFMTFLFAIIIAAYYPMVLFATMRGYQEGLKIITNYFFGLIAFEMTNVGLAIVQNLVLYYSTQQFTNALLTLSQNPLSIGAITEYMAQQATMQGVAGILGAISIPLTVGIILKGEVMAASGLLGGIKGLMAGDLLATASGEVNQNISQQVGRNNELAKTRDALGQAQTDKEIESILGGQSIRSTNSQRLLAELQAGMAQVSGWGATNKALSNNDGSLNSQNIDAMNKASFSGALNKVRAEIAAGSEIRTIADNADKSAMGVMETMAHSSALQSIEQTNQAYELGKHGTDEAFRAKGHLSGLSAAAEAQGNLDMANKMGLVDENGLDEADKKDRLKKELKSLQENERNIPKRPREQVAEDKKDITKTEEELQKAEDKKDKQEKEKDKDKKNLANLEKELDNNPFLVNDKAFMESLEDAKNSLKFDEKDLAENNEKIKNLKQHLSDIRNSKTGAVAQAQLDLEKFDDKLNDTSDIKKAFNNLKDTNEYKVKDLKQKIDDSNKKVDEKEKNYETSKAKYQDLKKEQEEAKSFNKPFTKQKELHKAFENRKKAKQELELAKDENEKLYSEYNKLKNYGKTDELKENYEIANAKYQDLKKEQEEAKFSDKPFTKQKELHKAFENRKKARRELEQAKSLTPDNSNEDTNDSNSVIDYDNKNTNNKDKDLKHSKMLENVSKPFKSDSVVENVEKLKEQREANEKFNKANEKLQQDEKTLEALQFEKFISPKAPSQMNREKVIDGKNDKLENEISNVKSNIKEDKENLYNTEERKQNADSAVSEMKQEMFKQKPIPKKTPIGKKEYEEAKENLDEALKEWQDKQIHKSELEKPLQDKLDKAQEVLDKDTDSKIEENKEQEKNIQNELKNVDTAKKATQTFMKGVEAQTAKKLASTFGYGETIGSVDNAINTGELQGVESGATDRAIADTKIYDDNGKEIDKKKAFKARGLQKGTQIDADAAGHFNTQMVDSQTGELDKDSAEYKGYVRGAEKESRMALNKTIGVGKADLVGENGEHITEEQFMSNLQKATAKGLLEQGVANAQAKKALENPSISGMDGSEGKAIRLNSNYAKGIGANEAKKIGNTMGYGSATDSDTAFKAGENLGAKAGETDDVIGKKGNKTAFEAQGGIDGQKAVSQADGALNSNIIDKNTGELKDGKALDKFKKGQEASVKIDIGNSEALGEAVNGKIKVKDKNGKEKEVDIDKNLESLMISPGLLKNREMFANGARMAERFGAIDENGNIDTNKLTSGKANTFSKKDALKQSIKQAETNKIIDTDTANKLLDDIDSGEFNIEEYNKDIQKGNKKQKRLLKEYSDTQKSLAQEMVKDVNHSNLKAKDKEAVTRGLNEFLNTGETPTNLTQSQQQLFNKIATQNKSQINSLSQIRNDLAENSNNLQQLDFMRNLAADYSGETITPQTIDKDTIKQANHEKHQAQKTFNTKAKEVIANSDLPSQEKDIATDAMIQYRQSGDIDYDKLFKKHNITSKAQQADFKSDINGLLNSSELSNEKQNLDTKRNQYNQMKNLASTIPEAVDLGAVSQIAGVSTTSAPITKEMKQEAKDIAEYEQEHSVWYRASQQKRKAQKITDNILKGEKFSAQELKSQGFNEDTIQEMMALQDKVIPQSKTNTSNKDLHLEDTSKQSKTIAQNANSIETQGEISLLDLADNQGKKKADSFIGEAVGTRANLEQNPDMYMRNANYSEQQRNQATDAKIEAQGGVKSAVATDVAESTVKATQQQKGLEGQISGLMSAGGIDSKDAKELSKAIIEGSQKGAEEFKKAIQAAGNIAQFQSQGKTAADGATTIGMYSSAEDYATAQTIKASKQEVSNKAQASFSANQEAKDKMIAQEYKRFKDKGKGDEYIEDGLKYGFLEQDENGNIRATTDSVKFATARATMNANGMNNSDTGVIAGTRVNTQYNPLSGDALVNLNDVNKIESGDIAVSNLGKPTTLAGANAQETTNILTSPSKWAETIAGKVGDATSEDTGTMGAMGIAAVAGVTALGVNDTIDTHKNKQNGVYVSKQTGEQIKISNGKVFNSNGEMLKDNQGNPLTPDDVKNSNEFRAKRGFVGETLHKGFDKANEGFKKISPFKQGTEESVNSTSNNSTNHQDSKTQPQTNDNSTHNKTPFKSDNVNGSTHFSKSQEFSKLNEANNEIKNLKTSAPEILNEMLNNKDSEIDEKVNKGEITPKEAQHKKASINNARVLANNSNSLNVSDLQNAGITTKDLKEKGFVVENNNKGFPHKVNLEDSSINFEMSKQDMLKTNQEKMDITKTPFKAHTSHTPSIVPNKSIMKHSVGTMAKKIPGVGAFLTAADVAQDVSRGDYVGAALDLASGVASIVPGVGTAASFAIDGINMAREHNMQGVASTHTPTTSNKNGWKKGAAIVGGGLAAAAMFGTTAQGSEDFSQFSGVDSNGGYMGGGSSTSGVNNSEEITKKVKLEVDDSELSRVTQQPVTTQISTPQNIGGGNITSEPSIFNSTIPQSSGMGGMMFTDAGASFNQGGVMPSVMSGGGNDIRTAMIAENLASLGSNPFGGDLSKALNANFQSLNMTFEEQFNNLPIQNSFDEFQQNFAK